VWSSGKCRGVSLLLRVGCGVLWIVVVLCCLVYGVGSFFLLLIVLSLTIVIQLLRMCCVAHCVVACVARCACERCCPIHVARLRVCAFDSFD
jgi:hypothetical protein